MTAPKLTIRGLNPLANPEKPLLVLVHGGRDHCRNWDWVALDLRRHYHIIAPDLRGHGDSDWAVGSGYSMIDYVLDLSQLMSALAQRRTDLSNSLAYGNAAAASIADLLAQARRPFKNTVAQSDRADSIVLADHDYFDDLLNTLPDAYQMLARQGMYGDFFTFYLCDIMLKLNGKGGGKAAFVAAVARYLKAISG